MLYDEDDGPLSTEHATQITTSFSTRSFVQFSVACGMVRLVKLVVDEETMKRCKTVEDVKANCKEGIWKRGFPVFIKAFPQLVPITEKLC